ncbi:MAG: hypothetical protein Q8P90_04985 [bacterium]|nr:hypothetical protein [bacterium]
MTLQTGPTYIQQCRQMGFSDDEIKVEMKKNGWQDADLHAAFAQAAAPTNKKKGKSSKLVMWIVIAIVAIVVLGGIGLLAFLTL